MFRSFRWIVLIAIAWTCGHDAWTAKTHAQESPLTSVEWALQSSTLGVAWVDPVRADLDSLKSLAESLGMPVDPKESESLEAMRKALVLTKATRVYLIGEFLSIVQGKPMIVIDSKDPEVTEAWLTNILPLQSGMKTAIQGQQVIVASNERLESLKQPKSEKPHAGLIEALKSVRADHGVVASVPRSAREMMSVLLLNYPKPEEGIKIHRMLMGFESGYFTVDEATKKFQLRLDFENEAVAKEFFTVIDSNAGFAAELPTGLRPALNQSTLTWTVEGMDAAKKLLQSTDWIRKARADAALSQRMNTLKQLGLAFHNFESAYRRFVPQALVSKDGKRLLSWRVMVLPFLEQQELYNQFHLDEPWDSPHNIELVSKMPPLYAAEGVENGKTTFQTLLAPDSAFGRPGKPITFPMITDGTSNTVWITEVDPSDAVIWTQPSDYEVTLKSAYEKLFQKRDSVPFGFIDGSVRRIPKTVSFETFQKVLTISGGEVVELP